MIIISLKNAIDVWEKSSPVGIVSIVVIVAVDAIEFITFTPNDINGWEKGANHPGNLTMDKFGATHPTVLPGVLLFGHHL